MASALEDQGAGSDQVSPLLADQTASALDGETEVLECVRTLHEKGLTLRAYEAAQRLGPLETWRGASAKVLAGRMAIHLGGARRTRGCISEPGGAIQPAPKRLIITLTAC